MSINFQSDNIVIIRYYGGGSGGEFLKNCLSLSNSAVMTHHTLAELQLSGKLDYGKKVNFLNSKISNNPLTFWDDLKLYGECLMGKNFGKLGLSSPEVSYHLKFNSIMNRLTNQEKKYIFIKFHNYYELNNVLKLFVNAKIINFINEDLFIDIRDCNRTRSSFFAFIYRFILINPKLYPKIYEEWVKIEYGFPEIFKTELISMVYPEFSELLKDKNFITKLKEEFEEGILENIWNKIGEKKWPDCPKYIREYMQFDPKLREQIQNNLNINHYQYEKPIELVDTRETKEEISKFMDDYSDKIVYTWNTNWYFSLEDTLKGFKELYELFELDNYDESNLSMLYNTWIDKIDEIKKFQLSE